MKLKIMLLSFVATSFIAKSSAQAMSVEADTTFSTPIEETRLSAPKKFPRPTASLTRRALNFLRLGFIPCCYDKTGEFFRYITFSQAPHMPENYFKAALDAEAMVKTINEQGLLRVQNKESVYLFCITKLGLNAATSIVTSFVNHVSSYLNVINQNMTNLDEALTTATLTKEMRIKAQELYEFNQTLRITLESLVARVYRSTNDELMTEQKHIRSQEVARCAIPQPIQLVLPQPTAVLAAAAA